MNKIFLFLFFIVTSLFLVHRVISVSFPSPSGYVSDFAGLYSSEFKSQMESDLTAFEKETGNEISVVTVKSLEGMDIESYAVGLFEKWKIGKKGKDNGLLLLISKEDRKIKIEVGYGLEPYITDGQAGEIIRNQMTPEFKNENYETGTLNAVSQIKQYISTQDVATQTTSGRMNSDGASWAIIGVLFLIYALITYIASFLGRTKEIWPGAVLGAVLGGIGGFLLKSTVVLVIGTVSIGLMGLFFDWILSRNFQIRKKKGLPTGFFNTWGGFSGGGSGGGGFGGFGGGGSGGGGSSGGW